MGIAAEKISEIAFNDIYGLFEQHPWLLYSTRSPLIELWNLCDKEAQQTLLKELLNRFSFIDTNQLNEISTKIYHKVLEWKCTPPNTFICAIGDSENPDGSTAGLHFIKNKFPSVDDWKESYFLGSIAATIDRTRNNDNLVLFDDFIGSGKTLICRINYLKDKLDERNINPRSIKVAAFAGMKFGIKEVEDQADVEVYAPIELKKGISDYETSEAAQYKQEIMKALESKLGKKFKGLKLRDHFLGYKRSETLFQIQGYNCPNNLFPIFWWPTLRDNSPRKTLFNRAR